jgi:hypothetical protein
MFKKSLELLLLLLVLNACRSASNSPKYQLSDGRYEFKQGQGKYKKAGIYVIDDSVKIFLDENPKQPFIPEPFKDQFLIKRSFDVDVITVPFKYRSITAGLPRQLTTDFNGNVYFGYRVDRFRLRYKATPVGWRKTYNHRGLTVGAFGGIGSTSVTPWTTNNQMTDEYSGFIFTRGLAVMAGINNLTVGLGIGWDYLTDRDRDIWIYQNKPWYGLTLGLNLN